ncbi:MAG: hypothetical protein HOV81_42705 [Kofleriaceae bacterium]|nr:hypothetical protein [Kofleriaceae bacterium]
MRRRRIVTTIHGVPQQLSPEQSLRLHVVRSVLTDVLTVEEGARLLDMPIYELSRLVDGARRAVDQAMLGRH